MHNSSIVKLGPGTSGGYLGISAEGSEQVIMSEDLYSVKFRAGEIARIVPGKQDIEGNQIPANSKVIISLPVKLNARKYNILTSFNPKLLEYGLVSCPPITPAKQCQGIQIALHNFKNIDLDDFDYIFELFMLD